MFLVTSNCRPAFRSLVRIFVLSGNPFPVNSVFPKGTRINSDGSTNYFINEDVYLFSTAGNPYYVDVAIGNSGTAAGLECWLTGYHN